jgi:hypothetical protein
MTAAVATFFTGADALGMDALTEVRDRWYRGALRLTMPQALCMEPSSFSVRMTPLGAM